MPSHTFTRVGSWKESIDTNKRSAEAARKTGGPAGAGEELHALDYQTYAYLQIAQDKAAKAVVDHAISGDGGAEGAAAGAAGAGAFAVAAIPARYALERGAWAEAAALPRASREHAVHRSDHALRARHRRRAQRQSRGGRPPTSSGWRRCATSAWSRRTPTGPSRSTSSAASRSPGRSSPRADKDEGVAQLAAAADAEDATDKSAVSPGPLAPARELLGYMLLEAGRPKEALVGLRGDDEEGAEPVPRRSTAARAPPKQTATRPQRLPSTRSCSTWSGRHRPTVRPWPTPGS